MNHSGRIVRVNLVIAMRRRRESALNRTGDVEPDLVGDCNLRAVHDESKIEVHVIDVRIIDGAQGIPSIC